MWNRTAISLMLRQALIMYLLPTRIGRVALPRSSRPGLDAPIVVGGTGGSGTRVVKTLLSQSDVFMGGDLNAAGDAMPFEPLLERWINPLLARTSSLSYRLGDVTWQLRRQVAGEFRRKLWHHLTDLPPDSIRWGWKNPRSLYILPFVHAVFPRMYFVHVMRDGRDIAMSDNQNQYRKHYTSLFGCGPGDNHLIESCRMWARTNADAADWGETTLGRRYVRLRLEDLCATPEETAAGLLDELGLDPGRAAGVIGSLLRLPTIGRWRTLPEELGERMTVAASLTLRRFGYHRL